MVLNKHIISNFSKATDTYEKHACVQKKSLYYLNHMFPKYNRSRKTVLDFGCGTGLSLNYLKKFKTIYLLEPCNNFQAYLKKRSAHNIKIIPSLQAIEEPLDLIMSNFVIHWLDNVGETLNMFESLLKPQGLLIFSTVLPSSFQVFQKLVKDLKPHSRLTVESFPTTQTLKRLKPDNLLLSTYQIKIMTLYFKSSADILRHFKNTGVNYQKKREFWTKKNCEELDKSFKEIEQLPFLNYNVGLWKFKKK